MVHLWIHDELPRDNVLVFDVCLNVLVVHDLFVYLNKLFIILLPCQLLARLAFALKSLDPNLFDDVEVLTKSVDFIDEVFCGNI